MRLTEPKHTTIQPNSKLEDFRTVFRTALANNPEAHALLFWGDDPTVFTVFDWWGPHETVETWVKRLNKELRHPTGTDAVFQGDGSFDTIRLDAAIRLLDDPDEGMNVIDGFGPYGSAVSRFGCPGAAKRLLQHATA